MKNRKFKNAEFINPYQEMIDKAKKDGVVITSIKGKELQDARIRINKRANRNIYAFEALQREANISSANKIIR
jgi:hypothetical protein